MEIETEVKTLQSDVVEEDGLLSGCVLDGQGDANLVGWKKVKSWKEADGPLWVHLDRS